MGKLGRFDFTGWMYGLAWAFLGGGAGAVASGFAVGLQDPSHYSPTHEFHNFFILVCKTFAITGTVSFFGALHQQPLPAMKKVETTVETTAKKGQAVVTVETVKETHVEPLEPKS